MEILGSQRRIATGRPAAPTLSLYCAGPALEIHLEDFELYAIDRLRVLKGITDGLSRGKKPEKMEKLVSELWRANVRHQDASEVMNKDIVSHQDASDGVGLKLEDALAFWRAEFSQKVGAERFDKEYACSICHICGKEGKQDIAAHHKVKIVFTARIIKSRANPQPNLSGVFIL